MPESLETAGRTESQHPFPHAALRQSRGANDESTIAPVARHWAWADLTRRAFDIDVLACPRCGERLPLIATVEGPGAIRAILAALAESRELTGWAPPSAAAQTLSQAATIGA